MKTILILLGVVCSFFAQAQDKEHLQLLQNEQARAQSLFDFRGDTEERGFDVVHQGLNLQIDPAVNAISGEVTTTFKVTTENLAELRLDLVDALDIDEILYQGTTVAFSHNGGKITIPFPTALPLGTVESVQITYHGSPSSSGFGSFEQTTHVDTVPVIWTLSEPYGAFSWWPCKQDLIDKIDSLDVTVTVPAGNKVASNGVLVEHTMNGLSETYHWKHRYPIPTYLVAFATTNYVAYSDFVPSDSGDIEILNYVYPESLEGAMLGTSHLVPVMQTYNELFGIYPFWKEKYGHAQFGWSGGMEHTTMTFCKNFQHGLLSHELAHQWFGDDATCGSWEDIWLNEGFATYLEGLTYEHDLYPYSFDNWLVSKINTVIAQPGGSVKATDTTTVYHIFNWRLSYCKGAMVLHMLRWKVGDENFFQGVRNYLADPLIHYGFAKTPQLKAHLEATSGQDLTEFFDSWYSGEGYPIYTVRWQQDENNLLTFSIEQSQSVEANYFKMPVQLRAIGESDTIDVVVQNDFNGQQYSIQLSMPITELAFDPAHWLIAKSQVINGPLANESIQLADYVVLSPNPTKDILHIDVKGLDVKQMKIYDFAGRLIERFDDKRDLDVSGLRPGMYLLMMETAQGVGSMTFTKE